MFIRVFCVILHMFFIPFILFYFTLKFALESGMIAEAVQKETGKTCESEITINFTDKYSD